MVGIFKQGRAGALDIYLPPAIEQLDILDSIFSKASVNLQVAYHVQVDFAGGRFVGFSGVDGVVRVESKLITDGEGICYSILFYDENVSVPELVRRPLYILNLHTESRWVDSSGQPLYCDRDSGEYSFKTVVEIVMRVLDSQLQLNTLRSEGFLKSLPKSA